LRLSGFDIYLSFAFSILFFFWISSPIELWEFIKRLEILSSHLSLQPNVELTIPSSLKKKHENDSAGTDPLAIHEVCPVCASKFSVDSICKAHCENGHIWGKCKRLNPSISVKVVKLVLEVFPF